MSVGTMCDSSEVSINLADLMKHLESRDSRLSVVESCLRKIDEREQIWSRITQDGLADLSVQVKAATQGGHFMQQKHSATKVDDYSQVCERLSNVEKQVQTMQTTAQNVLALSARISNAEHQLLELQASIQDIQVKHPQEVQKRHDVLSERLNVVSELCSLLTLNQEKLRAQFQTVNVPDSKNETGVSPNFSAPTLSRRTLTATMHSSSSGSVPARESPRQQLLFRADGLPQLQEQCQCQEHTLCSSRAPQPKGKDATLPQAIEKIASISGNQLLSTRVPSKVKTTTFSAGGCHLAARVNLCDMNREVFSLVSPAQNYRVVNQEPTCTHLITPRHPF